MNKGHHSEKSRADEILRDLSFILDEGLLNGFNWKIWFVDDEIKGKEKEYYNLLKEHISKILNLNNKENFGEFEKIEQLKKELKTELQNADIIFIDLMFRDKPEGVLECLPYLTKFRGVNRLPLIIGLSRIETMEWVWAFLKRGADAFIPKDQFLYLLSMGKEAFLGFIAQCLLKDINLWENLDKFAEDIKLSPNTADTFNKETIFLLKRIFYPYIREGKPINLNWELTSGKSGAITLKVIPKIGDIELHPRFVKIDLLHKMTFEKYAFEKYIRGNLENFCGRIDDPVAYGKKYAGIAYTGIGIPEDYKKKQILSFSKFLLTSSKEEIKKGLETLFSKILFNLHEKKENSAGIDLKKFLTKFYPIPGEGQFDSSDNCTEIEILEAELNKNNGEQFLTLKVWDKEKKGVYKIKWDKEKKGVYKIKAQEIREVLFPLLALFFRPGKKIKGKLNPSNDSLNKKQIIDNKDKYKWKKKELVEALVEIINDKFKNVIKHLEKNVSDRGKWYAIIHGDLNLDAIQYTPPGNFWLIDFAKTQKGYVAIDYVKLEVEIRTHLISDYLYNYINSPLGPNINIEDVEKFLKSIETELAEARFDIIPSFKFNFPWLDEHSLLEKLYSAINQIRHLFWINYRRCYEDAEERKALREYRYTLLHYALETTKFKNLKEPWEDKDEERNNSKSAPLPLLLSLTLAEVIGEKLNDKN